MVTGLQIRDAVVRYGPVTAVAGVSLDVAPGEVVALLGASGSGKSSLLRAVAGLEPLAAGSVSWDGLDLTDVAVHRRGFAMMFQDGQLFPHLSVAGNVGYALAGRERGERDRRVAELLELVDLAGYGRRPVTALSGGQAQRVALARSLAASPRLLMLDEPLSALDTGLREHLLGVLDETLRATATPALYVTHDQDEAFAIADRVAVLAGGKLLQIDDPATLWREPADPEVAAFLGYRLFLGADEAAALGWPGPVAGVVAVGPEGLVSDPQGTEVAVLGVRPRRGGTEFSVAIPSGVGPSGVGGMSPSGVSPGGAGTGGAGTGGAGPSGVGAGRVGTGREGRVRTAELSTHADRRRTITVRLDPSGCVVMAAAPNR